MPPVNDSPFFRKFLTQRHLLTWRSSSAMLLLGLTVGGLGFWYTLYPPAPETTRQAVGSPISVAPRLLKVATRPISAAGPASLTHEFTGVVMPRRVSQLAAKVVGRIESIAVDLGDDVANGQVLVELDHAELDAARGVAEANLVSAKARLQELQSGPRRQDIEQAQARVTELQAALKLQQANYARTERLVESMAITAQELEESKFALDASVAQLDAAQQALEQLVEGSRQEHIEMQIATVAGLESQLKRIAADLADRTITAPFSGKVRTRYLDEGSIVSPGQALLEILESPPYEVRVGLPDHLAALSSLEFAVFSGEQPLAATIERTSPTIDEATRAREVVLRMSESASSQVSLGAAVKVRIQQRNDEGGYWVPTQSLTSGARGLWAVFVAVPVESETVASAGLDSAPSASIENVKMESGRRHVIERRQVELLRSHGDWSQIQGPLSLDELLVVAGVHRVTPGQFVAIAPQ
ncbi:MAG: biotin/lipoyl-binding protein [Pirellulaceae bacterium]